MAWSTGPAFGFPKLGSPASPRLCLLVVYRWSLGCANPSVSLFCADQCTYRKHWSFTNSTANLSKVLGGKFTNIKHFFFFTSSLMSIWVWKCLSPLYHITFISSQTVSIDVKKTSMSYICQKLYSVVTGKYMYNINFCMCAALANWVWNKC